MNTDLNVANIPTKRLKKSIKHIAVILFLTAFGFAEVKLNMENEINSKDKRNNCKTNKRMHWNK